jgi:hypothetical protein
LLKRVEDSNKHIIEEIVCQIDYIPELYEDARFEKYKNSHNFVIHCTRGSNYDAANMLVRATRPRIVEGFRWAARNIIKTRQFDFDLDVFLRCQRIAKSLPY